MKIATVLVGALMAVVPVASQAATVVYTTFETQGAASSPTGYCYFLGNYAGPCAAGTTTGGGNTSGLQFEGNTPWPGVPTPNGKYYAFIQSGYGDPGSISQLANLAAGRYVFSWLEAGRPGGGGNQAYDVTLTGTSGTQTLYSGASTTNEAFTRRSAGIVTIGSDAYTLTFGALNSGGDNAAFIDAITVTSVPEPAVWGMMILGFGAVGGLLRRRKAVVSADALRLA